MKCIWFSLFLVLLFIPSLDCMNYFFAQKESPATTELLQLTREYCELKRKREADDQLQQSHFKRLEETKEEILRKLEEKADPNVYDGPVPCFNKIVETGDEELVNTFLSKSVNPHITEGQPFLKRASSTVLYACVDMATRLICRTLGPTLVKKIRGGAVPGIQPGTEEEAEIVTKMIKSIKLEYIVDATGLFTPLHIAAHYNYNKIITILLDHNAHINKPSRHGFTPLHIAAVQGNKEAIALLLKKGASLELKDCNDFTPLMVALKKALDEYARDRSYMRSQSQEIVPFIQWLKASRWFTVIDKLKFYVLRERMLRFLENMAPLQYPECVLPLEVVEHIVNFVYQLQKKDIQEEVIRLKNAGKLHLGYEYMGSRYPTDSWSFIPSDKFVEQALIGDIELL